MRVTNIVMHPSYFIADMELALQSFTRLRWYRGYYEKGPFFPLTDQAPQRAYVAVPTRALYAMSGKTLSCRVGTVTQNISFVGADPHTPAQVRDAILAAAGVVDAVIVDDVLYLRSATTGTDASIEVLESTGAAGLHLAAGTAGTGLGQDMALVTDQHEYFLVDGQSGPDCWYRVQLYHHITEAMSPMSVAFNSMQPLHLPADTTVMAFVRCADMGGHPIPNREIVLHNAMQDNRIEEYGIFRHYVKLLTDRNGYAAVRVLRGLVCDVSVTGSGFVRRIQIPLTGNAVDLLDPTLVLNDEFGVQEPRVDYALRSS